MDPILSESSTRGWWGIVFLVDRIVWADPARLAVGRALQPHAPFRLWVSMDHSPDESALRFLRWLAFDATIHHRFSRSVCRIGVSAGSVAGR